MKTFIERLFAVNWRTSLIGLLETVVALSTAWALLPDAWRKNPALYVPALCLALLKTLRESQTKDKQVSGNPSEGFVVGAKPDELPRVIDAKPPVL